MPPVGRALQEVRHRIADACARSRRDPGSVTLVAVSKGVGTERILEALAAGHDLFGENRVQEALTKISAVGTSARWHLVGHLQKNKARHAAGTFGLIHSLGDADLAREIDRRAGTAGIVQGVLVQVNLSREATKHGALEAGVLGLLEEVRPLEGLEIRGLMTIPPPADDAEESRPWFVRLRELRDRAAAATGLTLPELSMGMSDDFEVAIEEGATLLRVGRAIFGERHEPG